MFKISGSGDLVLQSPGTHNEVGSSKFACRSDATECAWLQQQAELNLVQAQFNERLALV